MNIDDPGSHVSGRMKRLATPWVIALDRARRLSDFSLGEGALLDIACGSSLQLAAYCSVLNRPGVGIDIEQDCISSSNKTMSNALPIELMRSSELICGDCLSPSTLPLDEKRLFSLLHLDPARPDDVQKHTLEEMQPNPLTALEKWWNRLYGEPDKKMIILDLSPRLSNDQCAELDERLSIRFPNTSRTWEWVSQGKGRVDRLSIWMGGAATSGSKARYVRIPPKQERGGVVLEAADTPWKNIVPNDTTEQPKIGDFISLVDPALLASGIEKSLFLDDDGFHWLRRHGRRPLLLHRTELPAIVNLDLLITTGEIRKLVELEPEQDVGALIEVGSRLGFSRLTLRLSMEPSIHPQRQRELDRQLPEGGSFGFVVRLPSGALAICG